MKNTHLEIKSVIAISITTNKTRTFLFEIVEGKYNFIASGETIIFQQKDPSYLINAIHDSLYQLEEITSRKFLGDDKQFIIPGRSDGAGTDQLFLTYSGGDFLRVVITGLLEDASIQNAKRLVNSTFTSVVHTIGLNDKRDYELQIDALIQSDPDLILFSGGTDNGASKSILQMADLVAMVCKSLPFERRPEILYAANEALEDNLVMNFEKVARTHRSKNVLSRDSNFSWLECWDDFNDVVNGFRFREYQGVKDLCTFCTFPAMPSSHGVANMARFYSQLYDHTQTTLCIELTSDSITMAASNDGQLSLDVYPYGTDHGFLNALKNSGLGQLQGWLRENLPAYKTQDYLYQKSIVPNTLPLTFESAMIEDALIRCLLSNSLQDLIDSWPELDRSFTPIIVSGDFVNRMSNHYEALLTILDGIQPQGISTIILDKLGVIGSLGTIARANSYLPVQMMDTGIYTNLGTVICPTSKQRYGTPILNMRIDRRNGSEERITAKKGEILKIPLEQGESAILKIQCLKDTVIDTRNNQRFHSIEIEGGQCGILIDARGRPIELPKDDDLRVERIKTWHNSG